MGLWVCEGGRGVGRLGWNDLLGSSLGEHGPCMLVGCTCLLLLYPFC